MIRFITFEQYHGKKGIGSTRIRVHNLIKHWPEAGLYQYGENPDVIIFQKVYVQADYKFPVHFEGIKILDICDPDWLQNQNIKETVDAMDGVTCPTEDLAKFIRQLTDKPVKVIPDRHELPAFPTKPRPQKGEIKEAVWFGYKQNAELLQFAIPTLERMGIHLTVISNDDPSPWRWAEDSEKYQKLYTFKKYEQDSIFMDLFRADVCLLPQGSRPIDRFKSNNKTTLAWMAGCPVATDGDELRRLNDPKVRNAEAIEKMTIGREQFEVKSSVSEMQDFISELKGLAVNSTTPLPKRG